MSVFGVVTTSTGLSGIFNSLDLGEQLEEATTTDPVGNVDGAVFYNPVISGSIKMRFVAGNVPDLSAVNGVAKQSEIITLANCSNSKYNGKYFVTKVDITEAAGEHVQQTVEVKRYSANNIPE